MVKHQFKKQKRSWGSDKLELFEKINEIIEKYQEDGYELTLRQLYYQLVSRDLIPNKDSEYKKLSSMLNDARYYGFVDWDSIVDRTRRVIKSSEFNNVNDLINSAIHSYRKNRHANQLNHVEIWCEKDALSSILEPIAHKYHLNLMVNRGYSSLSAMFESMKRIVRNIQNDDESLRNVYILYLGDHDPSGLDMIRDIKDRMGVFGVYDDVLTVKPVALTMSQIEEYDPPPNPAKVTDKRANNYIQEFGQYSWEVDALKPEIINEILENEIESLIDMDMYNDVIKEERKDIQKLKRMMRRF